VKVTIRQGDIYWVQPEAPDGEPPRISHPHVIIQDDALNQSDHATVVACALTTNLARVSMPGNILLDAGEANLPRPSVVEVSKSVTVEKAKLGEYIGTLSAERVAQILAGRRFVETSFLPDGRKPSATCS